MSESPELAAARKRARETLKDYQDALAAFLAVDPYPPPRSRWTIMAEHQRRKQEHMHPWIRNLDRARERVRDVICSEAGR